MVDESCFDDFIKEDFTPGNRLSLRKNMSGVTPQYELNRSNPKIGLSCEIGWDVDDYIQRVKLAELK
ncbi:hypothetical protein [Desulforhopalus sp. IMCC35007]|uniref:hypothetical protein n=1 Tax=Desulforhopalus sp. IMCC35007 TaxID=2569543 RepID=UPI0010ADC4CB|nr:hypothetical protein [Desulforhopalus sp. IMCC35007]TKB05922.1 hypothetical protein FCL48_23030 [Desulforhopalus sp. IMCC35007]